MQSVAQGWLALELTDDPLMVGVVSAAGSLPVLFLTLYVQRLSIFAGIASSVGTVVFVYVVFVRLLDVPIPSGPLGF